MEDQENHYPDTDPTPELWECKYCNGEYADPEDNPLHTCADCGDAEFTAKECQEWYGLCYRCSWIMHNM